MMRFHRLSPDILPLPNARKPSTLRTTCKDDDLDHANIQSYAQLDPKPQKSRSNPSPTRDDPNASNNLTRTQETQSSSSPSRGQGEINGLGNGDLLQWGHNKRSRGSRAEGRSPMAAAAPSRKLVKIQRRSAAIAAAEKVAAAAAAMPPPVACTLYSRGANLRPSSAGRECRSVDDRSGGLTRSDKRSPPSPARKSLKNAAPNGDCTTNPEPKHQEHDTTGSGGTGGFGGSTGIDKMNLDRFELPRIYLTLSRKEKEDDFLAMKGTKLPQRPKKRAKNVDKTLQYCFPGMWLSDLTRSRYEVREKKCVKKRRRGLKGMESMESDSE